VQTSWSSTSRTSEIADTISAPKVRHNFWGRTLIMSLCAWQRTIFQKMPGKMLQQNPNVTLRIHP